MGDVIIVTKGNVNAINLDDVKVVIHLTETGGGSGKRYKARDRLEQWHLVKVGNQETQSTVDGIIDKC